MSGLFQTIPNGLVFTTGNQSIGGLKSFTDTTASTSTTTGTTFAGGVGIAGALNVGGNITAPTQTATDNSTKAATTAFAQSLCRPAFNVFSAADQTTSADGLVVVFGTESVDTNNAFSSSTFTTPIAGSYIFGGGLYLVNLDAIARTFAIFLTLNGADARRLADITIPANTGLLTPMACTILGLSVNDIIRVKISIFGASFSYRVANGLSGFFGFRLPI